MFGGHLLTFIEDHCVPVALFSVIELPVDPGGWEGRVGGTSQGAFQRGRGLRGSPKSSGSVRGAAVAAPLRCGAGGAGGHTKAFVRQAEQELEVRSSGGLGRPWSRSDALGFAVMRPGSR